MIKGYLLVPLFICAYYYPLKSQQIEVISPYEKGILENGRAIGQWMFYDSAGRLSLSVDYDKNKLVFSEVDTSSFLAELSPGVWKKTKLTNPTRYIGSYTRLFEHYINYIVELNLKDELLYWLKFEIDTDGFAVNPEVIGGSNSRITNKILEAFKAAPNVWIPGSIENKTVKTRFVIPILKCEKECPSIKEIVNKKITTNGKIIFPIAIRIIKDWGDSTIRRPTNFSRLNHNQISWTPDDKYVFLKTESKEGYYTYFFNTTNFKLERVLYAPDPYLIFCASNDCDKAIINYEGKMEDYMLYEYSKHNSIKIMSKKNDFLQSFSPKFEKYLFRRRSRNGFDQLILKINEKQIDLTSSLEPNWGESSQSFTLISDSTLLRASLIDSWIRETKPKIEILNFITMNIKVLSDGNYEFISLSPAKDKILLREMEPKWRLLSKLHFLDLSSSRIIPLTKSFENITKTFWSSNSNNVFFSNGKKTFSVSVIDKSIAMVNNVSNPTFSNDGRRMVYFSKLKSNLVLTIANIDGSESTILHTQKANIGNN